MRDAVGRAAAARHQRRVVMPILANKAVMPLLKNFLCSLQRQRLAYGFNCHGCAVLSAVHVCPELERTGFTDSSQSSLMCVPYQSNEQTAVASKAHGQSGQHLI
eukprot:3379543-Prymnesium_polylepis.1